MQVTEQDIRELIERTISPGDSPKVREFLIATLPTVLKEVSDFQNQEECTSNDLFNATTSLMVSIGSSVITLYNPKIRSEVARKMSLDIFVALTESAKL